MKIGNVSFGAKIDRNTMDFVVKAREKGLETEKMEKLMKEVLPDETVRTTFRFNDEIMQMTIGGKTILNPKWALCLGSMSTVSVPQYRINQKAVDKITTKLEEIKWNECRNASKKDYENRLIDKFGEPVD